MRPPPGSFPSEVTTVSISASLRARAAIGSTEQAPQVAVAPLGDRAEPVLVAGGVLSRDQSDPGCKLASERPSGRSSSPPRPSTRSRQSLGSLPPLVRRPRRSKRVMLLAMIPVASGVQVWLAAGHADVRKGLEPPEPKTGLIFHCATKRPNLNALCGSKWRGNRGERAGWICGGVG
jgi:hypothetical protein